MVSIRQRIYEIFQQSNLKQLEFSERIGVSQSYVSTLFNEEIDKKPSDRLLKIICSEFNVNEEWLHHGTGDMFIQMDNLSLDEFARQRKMSDLESDLFKSFMSLEPDVRENVLDHLKRVFVKHEQAATIEEDEKKRKLREYELELDSEKNTETLSASQIEEDKGSA